MSGQKKKPRLSWVDQLLLASIGCNTHRFHAERADYAVQRLSESALTDTRFWLSRWPTEVVVARFWTGATNQGPDALLADSLAKHGRQLGTAALAHHASLRVWGGEPEESALARLTEIAEQLGLSEAIALTEQVIAQFKTAAQVPSWHLVQGLMLCRLAYRTRLSETVAVRLLWTWPTPSDTYERAGRLGRICSDPHCLSRSLLMQHALNVWHELDQPQRQQLLQLLSSQHGVGIQLVHHLADCRRGYEMRDSDQAMLDLLFERLDAPEDLTFFGASAATVTDRLASGSSLNGAFWQAGPKIWSLPLSQQGRRQMLLRRVRAAGTHGSHLDRGPLVCVLNALTDRELIRELWRECCDEMMRLGPIQAHLQHLDRATHGPLIDQVVLQAAQNPALQPMTVTSWNMLNPLIGYEARRQYLSQRLPSLTPGQTREADLAKLRHEIVALGVEIKDVSRLVELGGEHGRGYETLQRCWTRLREAGHRPSDHELRTGLSDLFLPSVYVDRPGERPSGRWNQALPSPYLMPQAPERAWMLASLRENTHYHSKDGHDVLRSLLATAEAQPGNAAEFIREALFEPCLNDPALRKAVATAIWGPRPSLCSHDPSQLVRLRRLVLEDDELTELLELRRWQESQEWWHLLRTDREFLIQISGLTLPQLMKLGLTMSRSDSDRPTLRALPSEALACHPELGLDEAKLEGVRDHLADLIVAATMLDIYSSNLRLDGEITVWLENLRWLMRVPRVRQAIEQRVQRHNLQPDDHLVKILISRNG